MYFVTGNKFKFEEARKVIPGLKQSDIDPPEVQSESLEEIARGSVGYAFKELGGPCFVEDAGMFIDAFNGFPGPYSRYVHERLGCGGIVKLMEKVENRAAVFEAAIAYHDGEKVHSFVGKCIGTVAGKERGEGFGFDPIFIPEGGDKTFAEDMEYKQKVSHRRLALDKLVEFLGA